MTSVELLEAVLDEIKGLRADMKTRPQAPSGAQTGAVPDCLPNYGKNKKGAIRDASDGDLEYYASGCRRSIADPAKARWIENETRMLDAINAEIARRNSAGQGSLAPSGNMGQQPDPTENWGAEDDPPF